MILLSLEMRKITSNTVLKKPWKESIHSYGTASYESRICIMMPKSWNVKEILETREWRVKKPDLDNLLKLVKDACSGIVYLDDNTIVQVTARKIQCAQDEAPYTRVCFEEIEELNALHLEVGSFCLLLSS